MRPIRFTVGSSDHAAQVIRKARNLRTIDGHSSVYISPDRAIEERRAYKQLFDQIKLNKLAEPDKVFAIKINKIVRNEPKSAGII